MKELTNSGSRGNRLRSLRRRTLFAAERRDSTIIVLWRLEHFRKRVQRPLDALQDPRLLPLLLRLRFFSLFTSSASRARRTRKINMLDRENTTSAQLFLYTVHSFVPGAVCTCALEPGTSSWAESRLKDFLTSNYFTIVKSWVWRLGRGVEF